MLVSSNMLEFHIVLYFFNISTVVIDKNTRTTYDFSFFERIAVYQARSNFDFFFKVKFKRQRRSSNLNDFTIYRHL